MQQFFAGQGGADGQAAAGAFEAVDFGFGDGNLLVHVQTGIQQHHGRHHFGNRSDGADVVDVFLVKDFVVARVHNQGGAGVELRAVVVGLLFDGAVFDDLFQGVGIVGGNGGSDLFLFEKLADQVFVIQGEGAGAQAQADKGAATKFFAETGKIHGGVLVCDNRLKTNV